MKVAKKDGTVAAFRLGFFIALQEGTYDKTSTFSFYISYKCEGKTFIKYPFVILIIRLRHTRLLSSRHTKSLLFHLLT